MNRLENVEYSKKGSICNESDEDKKLSREKWVKSLDAWDFLDDMKLDLELGIIK